MQEDSDEIGSRNRLSEKNVERRPKHRLGRCNNIKDGDYAAEVRTEFRGFSAPLLSYLATRP